MKTNGKSAALVAPLNGKNGLQMIPLGMLQPNPHQARQDWSMEKTKDEDGKTPIDRLAESIKTEGILQPLLVTPQNGKFVIVCGERRFRAAQQIKLGELPCVVRPGLDERAQLELSIVENLQREDLTPIDEAKAYQALIDKCKLTQKQLSQRLGISEPAVNFRLSLLKLSPELQKSVHSGEINETQGRTIVQSVNKIRGIGAEKKQHAAMAQIHERLEKARTEKPKLDSKDVKAVAKTVVEAQLKPRKGAKQEKHEPVKPSKQEASQASAFFKALEKVEQALKPFESLVQNSVKRARFADVLVAIDKNTAQGIKLASVVLAGLYEAAMDAKRRGLAAKLG